MMGPNVLQCCCPGVGLCSCCHGWQIALIGRFAMLESNAFDAVLQVWVSVVIPHFWQVCHDGTQCVPMLSSRCGSPQLSLQPPARIRGRSRSHSPAQCWPLVQAESSQNHTSFPPSPAGSPSRRPSPYPAERSSRHHVTSQTSRACFGKTRQAARKVKVGPAGHLTPVEEQPG